MSTAGIIIAAIGIGTGSPFLVVAGIILFIIGD